MRVENHLFLLRRRRRELARWLRFLQEIGVFLDCGYELGYAWERLSKRDLPNGSIHAELQRLAREGEPIELRPWFEGLAVLQRSGSALIPYLTAFTQRLSDELRREMDRHVRSLPLRLNVLLLLFCLPPLLALIFTPLLSALSMAH